MFKLGMALMFAVIAALAIGLAGLLTDVRFSTIFLRSLVGFLLAGVCSYLVVMILELKGWVGYDTVIEIPPAGEMDPESEEAGLQDEEIETEEEAVEEMAEEEAEAGGFAPFSADKLNRVEPPSAP